MTTKPDRGEREDWTLSPSQDRAAQLIAAGSTLTAVGEVVAVTRQTVSQWNTRHLGFQAAVMRYRSELWGEQKDRLRALGTPAIAVLEAALDVESSASWAERLRAAEVVLKAIAAAPDLYAVEDLELENAKREQARQRELLMAAMPW